MVAKSVQQTLNRQQFTKLNEDPGLLDLLIILSGDSTVARERLP